jgi:hypothetical protein
MRHLYSQLTARWLGQEAEELRSTAGCSCSRPRWRRYTLAMGLIAWDFVISSRTGSAR